MIESMVEAVLIVFTIFILTGGIVALARQVKPSKSLLKDYQEWKSLRDLKRRASKRMAASSRSNCTESPKKDLPKRYRKAQGKETTGT